MTDIRDPQGKTYKERQKMGRKAAETRKTNKEITKVAIDALEEIHMKCIEESEVDFIVSEALAQIEVILKKKD